MAREVDLVARVAEGDRRAFEELYHLYHRRMARFLTRLTHRYDLAEEVINDTFWVVWRKARDFRGDSQPSTWILGIAYRKARPVEQRLAVELCYELGYSCQEIATIMDCPVNTVKTRLFHARAKLQKLLPQLAGAVEREGARPVDGPAAREGRES